MHQLHINVKLVRKYISISLSYKCDSVITNWHCWVEDKNMWEILASMYEHPNTKGVQKFYVATKEQVLLGCTYDGKWAYIVLKLPILK